MSKDELRKDVKQLQEVILNVANMHSTLNEEYDRQLLWVRSTFGDLSLKLNKAESALSALQEDHAALKKQFMLAAATGLHASGD